MKVKMAVFGREEVLQLVQLYVSDKEQIEVIPFIYENESDVIKLMERAVMCDVYIITEHLPFLAIQELINKKHTPVVQVEVDAYMLLTSLYRLRKQHKRTLHRVSIDIPCSEVLTKVFDELGIDDPTVYTYAYGTNHLEFEPVLAYHQELWEKGAIDYVLTSSRKMKKHLLAKGIPSKRMVIPINNITDALEQAASIVTLHQSVSNQIVAGVVDIRNKSELLEAHGKSYLTTIIKNIEQTLIPFKEETDTSLFMNNDQQFVLFGTKGMFEYITTNYRDFPLLNKIEERIDPEVTVDIGFGLGLHALEAEQHAKIALESCREMDGHTCYIVNERREVIGPIGVKKHFNTSMLYRDLIHKARLGNQLSYNFIDFITNRNNEPFSSNDVAEHYNVTKRSAERTINKLLHGDVIEHVGEERPYMKGRPRKLFQIVQ